MPDTTARNVLLCWEAHETNSWNPVLAQILVDEGIRVTEVHEVEGLRALDLSQFDVCLPRFRVGAANMTCLDEVLVSSGVPMLNSRDARRRCENKALAHLAFEAAGLPQPPSLVMSCEGVCDRHLEWKGETLIKPLYGNRSAGIEICDSQADAMLLARARGEDMLIQQLIWPARCWRVIVGREAGIVDPYWRKPPHESDRLLSISTGSTPTRSGYSPEIGTLAVRMLEAVDGDLLAVDILETADAAYALEINHNFDAHGGDRPAAEAFLAELQRIEVAQVVTA